MRAGTPQQCATEIADTFLRGFNHLGFGLVDDRIVETLTGTDRRGERGPPEARRPSRSSSPPGCWASTRLTASRSSTLRPESPRPAEAKCYRRAAVRYPGHPGPRRHADDPVADGPASVSVRPARRPGLGDRVTSTRNTSPDVNWPNSQLDFFHEHPTRSFETEPWHNPESCHYPPQRALKRDRRDGDRR